MRDVLARDLLVKLPPHLINALLRDVEGRKVHARVVLVFQFHGASVRRRASCQHVLRFALLKLHHEPLLVDHLATLPGARDFLGDLHTWHLGVEQQRGDVLVARAVCQGWLHAFGAQLVCQLGNIHEEVAEQHLTEASATWVRLLIYLDAMKFEACRASSGALVANAADGLCEDADRGRRDRAIRSARAEHHRVPAPVEHRVEVMAPARPLEELDEFAFVLARVERKASETGSKRLHRHIVQRHMAP